MENHTEILQECNVVMITTIHFLYTLIVRDMGRGTITHTMWCNDERNQIAGSDMESFYLDFL